MALTDIAIRNAKPHEKPYKMGNSLGLFLLVAPSGGKLWKLKFPIDGKGKKLSFGSYPDVSLKRPIDLLKQDHKDEVVGAAQTVFEYP